MSHQVLVVLAALLHTWEAAGLTMSATKTGGLMKTKSRRQRGATLHGNWTKGIVEGCDCSWTSAYHCKSTKGDDGTKCWRKCCRPTPAELAKAIQPRNESWSQADWEEGLVRLPPARKAGLLHLQLGPWPRWTNFLLQSAAANGRAVNYYFLGSSKLNTERCANCVWLPLSYEWLSARVEARLGVRMASKELFSARKLCDLKPMWPSLLPELAQRHEWIGYADLDVLFGNLAAEVGRLDAEDDLLVPQNFYPQPLANGNMLLMRSVPRILEAFRHSSEWRTMLASPAYAVFDEWGHAASGGGAVTMVKVWLDMLLSGRLVARPTVRYFVQDVIVQQGHSFPNLWTRGRLNVTWRDGALTVERDGPCICPNDVVPQFVLTTCPECLDSTQKKPPAIVRSSHARRHVDAVALHFQELKKFKAFRAGTFASCPSEAGGGFALGKAGFACLP